MKRLKVVSIEILKMVFYRISSNSTPPFSHGIKPCELDIFHGRTWTKLYTKKSGEFFLIFWYITLSRYDHEIYRVRMDLYHAKRGASITLQPELEIGKFLLENSKPLGEIFSLKFL